MAANLLWVIGGVFLAIVAFTIAYNLILTSIQTAQKQNMLNEFSSFTANVESVCLQEINNSMELKLKVLESVRVIFTTDDTSKIEEKVIEKIEKKQLVRGKYICMQFKAEDKLRCEELSCDITSPYMGALEKYSDIQLFVKSLLGEAPVKEYPLVIKKTGGYEVAISLKGEDQLQ